MVPKHIFLEERSKGGFSLCGDTSLAIAVLRGFTSNTDTTCRRCVLETSALGQGKLLEDISKAAIDDITKNISISREAKSMYGITGVDDKIHGLSDFTTHDTIESYIDISSEVAVIKHITKAYKTVFTDLACIPVESLVRIRHDAESIAASMLERAFSHEEDVKAYEYKKAAISDIKSRLLSVVSMKNVHS